MKHSTAFEVGPNKKMARNFFGLSLALGCLGVLMFLGYVDFVFYLFNLIPIHSSLVSIILLSLPVFNLAILIYTHSSKKRIFLDSNGITLLDGTVINWDEIICCEVVQHMSIPIMLFIKLDSGKKIGIKWTHIDCGIENLAKSINEYLKVEKSDSSQWLEPIVTTPI